MGRHSQFGTLEETLSICQEVERSQLVIDWSHMHARSGGGLRTVEDFRKIVETAEERLGTESVRNMHCHFSKIEYTYKTGEKRHHVLDEPGFGPEFEKLAEIIIEFKLRPVIICETMLQDIDALKMQKTLKSLEKSNNRFILTEIALYVFCQVGKTSEINIQKLFFPRFLHLAEHFEHYFCCCNCGDTLIVYRRNLQDIEADNPFIA